MMLDHSLPGELTQINRPGARRIDPDVACDSAGIGRQTLRAVATSMPQPASGVRAFDVISDSTDLRRASPGVKRHRETERVTTAPGRSRSVERIRGFYSRPPTDPNGR